MIDENENQDEQEEQACPHCSRVNAIYEKLLELGYEINLAEVYMIDELLRIDCFPHIMRLMADSELLLAEYDDLHDEERILGHYERQIEKKDEEDKRD